MNIWHDCDSPTMGKSELQFPPFYGLLGCFSFLFFFRRDSLRNEILSFGSLQESWWVERCARKGAVSRHHMPDKKIPPFMCTKCPASWITQTVVLLCLGSPISVFLVPFPCTSFYWNILKSHSPSGSFSFGSKYRVSYQNVRFVWEMQRKKAAWQGEVFSFYVASRRSSL